MISPIIFLVRKMGRSLVALLITLALAPVAWEATIVTTLTNDSWEIPLIGLNVGTGHETTRAGQWRRRLAWSFVPSSDATTDGADLALARQWNTTVFPGNEVTISLYADAGGHPGTVLQTITLIDALQIPVNNQGVPDDRFVPLVRATWPSPQALVAGTTYWLVLQSPETTHATWFNAIATVMGPIGPECPQGRIGTGKRSQDGYNGGAWFDMLENHLYPTCSLAFRVTSP